MSNTAHFKKSYNIKEMCTLCALKEKPQFFDLPVLGEFLNVVVFVDGIVHPQVNQLLQSLVYEYNADQGGEGFLGEACDVADEGAGICGHQQQAQKGRPQADAGPQGEVGEPVLPETHTHEYCGAQLSSNKQMCRKPSRSISQYINT